MSPYFFQAIKFRTSSSQTTFLDRNIVHTLNVAPAKIPNPAGPTTANGDATDGSGFAALAMSSATAGAAPAALGDQAGDGGDKGGDERKKESLDRILCQDFFRSIRVGRVGEQLILNCNFCNFRCL